MFTALATTSAMAATETADCSIIMAFALRVSSVTSLAAGQRFSPRAGPPEGYGWVRYAGA